MSPGEREGVTGLILAGGKSRRMSALGLNTDKGLVEFKGQRLVDHVFGRLAAQVGGILINTNQNHDQYKGFGVRVVSDAFTGHAGPLAGLHAGLAVSRRPFLVTVPCDSPFFPEDMVDKLYDALTASGGHVAVVKTGDQPHPVFTLVRRTVYEHLSEFMKGGGRKIDEWYSTLDITEVDFNDENLFGNINTPEELQAYEQGLPLPPKAPKRRFEAPLVERRRRAPATPHDDVLDGILGNAGVTHDPKKRRRKTDLSADAKTPQSEKVEKTGSDPISPPFLPFLPQQSRQPPSPSIKSSVALTVTTPTRCRSPR